mmetsp:Transcript_25729/g.38932  ORF Transcript_25729/g.38932 Transcript_25729/m.38932 type:complete len:660 (-) Transcript_25729:90-2069(-)
MFLLGCMFAMSIVIAILKCLGRKRVGFWSGAAFRIATNDEGGRCCKTKRVLICRCIFMIATILYMAFSIVAVEMGITKIFDTAQTVVMGASMATNLAGDLDLAVNAITNFVKDIEERERELTEILDASPCFSGDQVTFPEGVTLEDVAELTAEFQNLTTNIETSMNKAAEDSLTRPETKALIEIILGATSDGRRLVQQVLTGKEEDDGSKNTFDISANGEITKTPFRRLMEERYLQQGDNLPNDIPEPEKWSTPAEGEATVPFASTITRSHWLSLLFYIPYVITGIFLLIFNGLAFCGLFPCITRCLTNGLFIPLLILESIFAYLLSAAVFMGGIANADFCSGGEENSPDESVRSLMRMYLETQEDRYDEKTIDYIRETAFMYISECQSGNPFDALKTDYFNVRAVVDLAQLAVTDAKNTTPRLQETCELPSLMETLEKTLGVLESFLDFIGSAISLLRCPNVSPVYQHPVYTGTCNYSVRGLSWTLGSFMAVAVCGHIMLILRASLKEEVTGDDNFAMANAVKDDNNDDEEAVNQEESLIVAGTVLSNDDASQNGIEVTPTAPVDETDLQKREEEDIVVDKNSIGDSPLTDAANNDKVGDLFAGQENALSEESHTAADTNNGPANNNALLQEKEELKAFDAFVVQRSASKDDDDSKGF